eukprot:TRINITY_DN2865_c0_g1_i5.p1 TRINITY_DN2865_c0_g1~~TRINITY_DN2865_c0_g1_i5.p1  ORF type:complete len:152 (+),score=24.52 TRINITY_DN2865_c0_g1_i5:60-515(+)
MLRRPSIPLRTMAFIHRAPAFLQVQRLHGMMVLLESAARKAQPDIIHDGDVLLESALEDTLENNRKVFAFQRDPKSDVNENEQELGKKSENELGDKDEEELEEEDETKENKKKKDDDDDDDDNKGGGLLIPVIEAVKKWLARQPKEAKEGI